MRVSRWIKNFGVVLALILLELGLRAGAALYSRIDRPANTGLSGAGEVRILCLGESTTARGGRDGWPAQLEQILNARSGKARFRVFNGAKVASESSTIIAGLEANLREFRPDMVIAMMGINDGPATEVFDDSLRQRLRMFLANIRIYAILRALASRGRESVLTAPQPDEAGQDETELRTAVERSPEDIRARVALACFYRGRGRIELARGQLSAALALGPGEDWVYIESANLARAEGDEAAAEKFYLKAIDCSPGYFGTYIDLVDLYRGMGENRKALAPLEHALELAPDEAAVRIAAGRLYLELELFPDAEREFRRALELDPDSARTYLDLFDIFQSRGRGGEADSLCARMEQRFRDGADAGFERVYACLASFFRERGQEEKALFWDTKLEVLSGRFAPATRHNYSLLVSGLSRRGIRLVAVQYPMRPVRPLKKMLAGFERVVFVDNEASFKKALSAYGYRALFTDRFAGDFGHATRAGNRLLAQNIASAVLALEGAGR